MSGQVQDLPENPLRAEMHRQGLGVERLAALSGVSGRLIIKYRSGQVIPRDYFGRPSANALKIARALDADPDDLFPARVRAA